jgi:LmbE family N-acetylglucosaminyl deacetylase
MNQPPVIVAILAHPDDESFGMGGTLALYAHRGCQVYLVCATGGEAGDVSPEHLQGFSSIAELRERELRCAAQRLGLTAVFFLGYRDSGMPGTQANLHPDAQINHSLNEVAGRVVSHIRALRADVVLTFDPIGGYRHPDHIHIQQATTLAFERAADQTFHPEAGEPHQPSALYYQLFPRRVLRVITRIMPLFGRDPRKWGRNRDIDMLSMVNVDFPTHVRVDIRSVAQVKADAGACHASQGGPAMRRGWMGVVLRLMGEREEYMQAYPPLNGIARVKRDLLADLI